MKNSSQKTIKSSVTIKGIGIHSGKTSALTIGPAPENYGIVFIKEGQAVKAAPENVADSKLGTSLRGIRVVEHLMAAIAGLEIDNLKIEIEGEEIPILDGSALPFAQKLIEAEIVDQPAEKKVLEIKKDILIEEEDRTLKAAPYDGFRVNFMVNYPVIGEQKRAFEGGKQLFLKEIAPARTFGLAQEVEELRRQGFARGANLNNALAIGPSGYLNQPRFPDEVVRHKILDLIGDLGLLGMKIKGDFTAVKSNHRMNLELVRRILKNA